MPGEVRMLKNWTWQSNSEVTKRKINENISKNYYLKVTLKLLYQQAETKQVSWFNNAISKYVLDNI